MSLPTFVAVAVVTACLLYTSFPVSAQGTTCGVNSACDSCTGDDVKNLTLASGSSVRVCCPNCRSRYFNFGFLSSGQPFCNCNFDRVTGSARKGEECSVAGMTTYFRLNQMPICCPDPLVAEHVRSNSDGSYIFNCEQRGDCWRGSQCSTCNQSYVGNINGVNVCCSNCDAYGLRLGPGKNCNCNRP
uniref:Latent transforming growth factor beta binding protein n=1 Tax=Haliotis diversicolor supertexta TaxID=283615 RepID=E4W3F5_HALDV|nr:latent transforming growth factor beta binding protein [Haliotis diversicolor supertexta]